MIPPTTIDILVPTRDRPKKMARLMQSARDTASDPKRLSFAFYIDTDDRVTLDAIPQLKKEFKGAFREVQYLVDMRMVQAMIYNRLGLFTNGDIIYYAADDISFNTNGWDDVVLKTFADVPDRILLAWGYDPLRIERGDPPFPDHGFISRWSKNVLKYIFPVFGPHPDIPNSIGCCYTDVWLKALYENIGRMRYLEEIEISHEHWHVKRTKPEDGAKMDDNYAIESILTDWRITPEFVARNQEIPNHAKLLLEWIEYVKQGGLDRVEPEIMKRKNWRREALAHPGQPLPADIIEAGLSSEIVPDGQADDD